ncbi:MAG: hypothetical protein VKP62_02265 [Candidatus Sericytochromatia bacterium]|nr:hypothetical protein [Candidatus Sericytochromatia bacterium]
MVRPSLSLIRLAAPLLLTFALVFTPSAPALAANVETVAFRFVLPTGYQLKALPDLGKAPRLLKQWELTREFGRQRLRIDIEWDRSEVPTKYPVRESRLRARRVAEALRYQNYHCRDLMLKGAPGFYDTWTAQVPPKPRFCVTAAQAFRHGARIRIAAIAEPGEGAYVVRTDLHALLNSWAWAD